MVAAISGGSGTIHGIRTQQGPQTAGIETHLILSRGATMTIATQCGWSVRDAQSMADACYGTGDPAPAVSSGSCPAPGMVVAPYSVKSLGQLATGACDTSLTAPPRWRSRSGGGWCCWSERHR
jgi:4-hydroxy-3-polyprenylbenzoate decarboxylase